MNMLIGSGIGCPYRWLIKIRYVVTPPRWPTERWVRWAEGEEGKEGEGGEHDRRREGRVSTTATSRSFVEVTWRINEIEISMEITVDACRLKRTVTKSNSSDDLSITSERVSSSSARAQRLREMEKRFWCSRLSSLPDNLPSWTARGVAYGIAPRLTISKRWQAQQLYRVLRESRRGKQCILLIDLIKSYRSNLSVKYSEICWYYRILRYILYILSYVMRAILVLRVLKGTGLTYV